MILEAAEIFILPVFLGKKILLKHPLHIPFVPYAILNVFVAQLL